MSSHSFIVSYLLAPGKKLLEDAGNIADLTMSDLGGWNDSGRQCATITGAAIKTNKVVYSRGSGDWAAIFGGGLTHDNVAAACLWCWIEGYGPPHWFGGMFEWCRADSNSVGMDNVGGWHGWGWNAIREAKKFAFALCNRTTGDHTNRYEF